MNELKKSKLSNGGVVLIEIPYEEGCAVIGAWFPMANHPYVRWRMNYSDRSCYWGHYYSKFADLYKDLYSQLNKDKNININFSEVKSFEINAYKHNHITTEIITCNIKEAEYFSLKSHMKDTSIKYISKHYKAIDCTSWGNWLSNKLRIPILNKCIGKNYL